MIKGFVVMVNFVVVDAPLHYNLILGRPWIHKMGAIFSTYHQVIKYPTEEQIMEIQCDQEKVGNCYNTTMN